MDLAYWLYMNEAEGNTNWINTREACIVAAIKDFVKYYNKGYDINDSDLQNEIFDKYNLQPLSEKEYTRIKTSIEHRI